MATGIHVNGDECFRFIKDQAAARGQHDLPAKGIRDLRGNAVVLKDGELTFVEEGAGTGSSRDIPSDSAKFFELLAIISICSGRELRLLGVEHPLNVVATYSLTLGALILSRAGLWFFIEKSLFVKRHVFLMVTKQNRWFQKCPFFKVDSRGKFA